MHRNFLDSKVSINKSWRLPVVLLPSLNKHRLNIMMRKTGNLNAGKNNKPNTHSRRFFSHRKWTRKNSEFKSIQKIVTNWFRLCIQTAMNWNRTKWMGWKKTWFVFLQLFHVWHDHRVRFHAKSRNHCSCLSIWWNIYFSSYIYPFFFTIE